MFKKILYSMPLVIAALFGFVLGHYHPASKAQNLRHVLYYVDPMHPAYKSTKPGVAPDCGMDLVPVYSDNNDKPISQGDAPRVGVKIAPDTQQLFGIQVARVEKSSGRHTQRVSGLVVPDQRRVYRINVGTDGFVKETYDDAVGNRVTQDQKLATIYSPDFLTVVGGYLSANERTQQSGTTRDTAAGAQGVAGVQAWADRLRNLGMSEYQIQELNRTRKIPEDIYVVSPVNGFVLSRDISPGQRFERHTEFYKVADLSHVWVLADLFGREAKAIKPGTVARIVVPDTGQSFAARVSDALPEVDPATRTSKLRLEVDNPGFSLRPDMFVDVELPLFQPPGLTIPADALVDSGNSKRVYVQSETGRFEPREVITGWRVGDRVEVVKGLKEGEQIVASGTFLVDSETRLHASSQSQSSGITGIMR